MSEGGQGGSNADSSSAIRVVPDFDALKLTRFLQGKLEGVQGSLVVEQFARGTTHLTHLLRAGEREYVLRRPLPFAREDGEASLLLEWRVLSALSSVWRRVPRALLVCEDPAVLGAPFYVMERVRGVILRARVRSGMELGPERMRRAAEAAVDTLAELHGIDAKAIGLDALDAGAGTLEADVAAWAARCARAQAVPLPAFAALAEWLPRHRPPPGGSVVIHNDWAYDNLVLDPVSLSRVVAVLDWERAGAPW